MDLILDSWQVLVQHGEFVAALLVCVGWGTALVYPCLKRLAGEHLSAAEMFALAVGGWPLPVLLTFVLLFFLGVFSSTPLNVFQLLAVMAIIGGLGIYIAPRLKQQPTPGVSSLFALGIIFFLLIFLRLAFIAKTPLPLYFDSAEHYRIVQALISQIQPPLRASLSWPVPTYYHLGFHVLTAILTASLRADAKLVILVLGQIILACIPIPFFFVVRRESRSDLAGLFAVVLAGFGWYMPAHAVDWGKYPALAGILASQFSLNLAYLLTIKTGLFAKRIAFWMSFIGSLLVSFFLHTRTVIVIGILIASWAAAGRWLDLPRKRQSLTLFLLVGLLAAFASWIEHGEFKPVFDPYLRNGILVTCVVLLLFPFALRAYPRPAVSGLLSIAIMLGGLVIPVRGLLPGFGELSLLDRPFVEMYLFMPLAWIGGLGFAALIQVLRKATEKLAIFHGAARMSAVLLLSGIIIANAFAKYSFYPSDCCQVVGYDDVVALDWMEENLPINAIIGIAGTEQKPQSSEGSQSYTGADAGVWITPLAGRGTAWLSYGLDFGQPRALHQLCEQNIAYIYVGGAGQSFKSPALGSRPDWYRLVFYLPKVQIYEVTGCFLI